MSCRPKVAATAAVATSPMRKSYPILMLTTPPPPLLPLLQLTPNVDAYGQPAATAASQHSATSVGTSGIGTGMSAGASAGSSSPGSPYSPLSFDGSASTAKATSNNAQMSGGGRGSTRKSKLINDIVCLPEGVPLDMATTVPRGRPPPSPLTFNSRQVWWTIMEYNEAGARQLLQLLHQFFARVEFTSRLQRHRSARSQIVAQLGTPPLQLAVVAVAKSQNDDCQPQCVRTEQSVTAIRVFRRRVRYVEY